MAPTRRVPVRAVRTLSGPLRPEIGARRGALEAITATMIPASPLCSRLASMSPQTQRLPEEQSPQGARAHIRKTARRGPTA